MYSGSLIVLIPFFIGYLIRVNHAIWHHRIAALLDWFVYLILFMMGIALSQLDDLVKQFQMIAYTTLVFFIFICGFNIITLIVIDLWLPWRTRHMPTTLPPRWKIIKESLQICSALLFGFIVGSLPLPFLSYATQFSQVILVTLLFLVGLQLQLRGMPLRQIIINKTGLITAVLLLISALFGGLLAAILLGIPVQIGFALSSTFGWYSLSSIFMTETYGPLIGSIAFFNDLLRELIATLLIPTLIGRYRFTALGLCGATSMDFTLPLLQKGGGVDIVPPAIVQGLILSVLAPILLTLFSGG